VWIKARVKGVNERFVSCLSKLYEGTKSCVRCGDIEMTTFVTQTLSTR
jgi:hypothetical protein